LSAVRALGKAAEIYGSPEKIANLMKDYGEDGVIDNAELRPVFEELREVAIAAFE
jgi:hypothetical protein